jgi:hypothetical protein
MKRLLSLALLLVPALSSAQQPFWPDEGPRTWAPRPTEAAITAADLRTRLYQFADDSMLGRDAGTWGNIKATDYLAAEFERLGLVPAGEDGSFFQEVGYGPSGFDQTILALTLPGGAAELRTAWFPLPPGLTEFAGDFDGRDIPVVFGGRWGDTASALDPALIAGKAVVFLPPADNANRFFQVDDPRAAGARLVLIAALDDAPANLATFALTTRNALHVTPAAGAPAGAAVTRAVAGSLFSEPLSALAVGASGRSVSGRWQFTQGLTEHPVRNVLAILPGSDPALRGQYVVIGAHNDHVGSSPRPIDHDSLRAFNTVLKPQGANDRVAIDAVTPAQWSQINALIARARAVRPPRPDSIFNGADDDGSGSMVLLEIAEMMATGEQAPRRSVLFNSHAAEEKGLLGSRWWTWHPTVPLDSVVAAHNMDMLGKGRVTDVRFGGPHSVQMLGSRRVSAEFGDLIDSLNAVRSEPMVIDYSWDRTNRLNRFCRSDQVNYIRAGIPTTYFSTGYSRDYHQLTDEPQYINYDLSARVARFVHDIAYAIADRPERLQLLPPEEQDPQARCGG